MIIMNVPLSNNKKGQNVSIFLFSRQYRHNSANFVGIGMQQTVDAHGAATVVCSQWRVDLVITGGEERP